ncbi:aldo/keto reductase [Caulobacter sp. KR2-114]|uniref:aldo/keto reductase n=1 Tax=Caulobacter sp. KR2-114 TaxID=3400912 RepID=UPI003C0B00C6
MTAITFSSAPRPLGKSGLTVSPIAWGMWRFRGDDVAAAQRRVEAALEAGFTLLDTADVYGLDNAEPFGAAEALLGRVLKASPGLRERFVLGGKAGIWPGVPYDSSQTYLTAAVEASLKRMNVERMDLFQIHRPDVLTHPADLARTLERLRDAGKIGAVGVSNFTAAQTAALAAHLPFPLASTQVEFSPVAIEPLEGGLLDQAMERDLGVLAWSPLGGGRLGDGATPDGRAGAVAAVLDVLARREGVSRAVIAYAWILAHPARPIPIVGTQDPARIAEAARALTVQLSRADWYGVLTAARGAPLP